MNRTEEDEQEGETTECTEIHGKEYPCAFVFIYGWNDLKFRHSQYDDMPVPTGGSDKKLIDRSIN